MRPIKLHPSHVNFRGQEGAQNPQKQALPKSPKYPISLNLGGKKYLNLLASYLDHTRFAQRFSHQTYQHGSKLVLKNNFLAV